MSVDITKEALVIEYINTKDTEIRDQIVELYRPLVEYIAKKLSFNRDDFDDLVQVGSLGLLRSLDRFDPSLANDFSTFATPNIVGEIKHYFRDKKSVMKIPRKLIELHSRVKRYIKEQEVLKHSPTVNEIADAMDCDSELVLECLEAGYSSQMMSLDSPSYKNNSYKDGGAGSTIIDNLSDGHHETFYIDRVLLKEAMKKLAPREYEIVSLRFYSGLSQTDISKRLNLSQMHISRLLNKALKQLKKDIEKK